MPNYNGSFDELLRWLALNLMLFALDVVTLVVAAGALRTMWPWMLGVLAIAAGITAATLWVQDWQRKHKT